MYYELTDELIDVISPYIDIAKISVSYEVDSFNGKDIYSDYLSIDKEHNVSFCVLEDEIIISFLHITFILRIAALI